jgi:hypothetical protein
MGVCGWSAVIGSIFTPVVHSAQKCHAERANDTTPVAANPSEASRATGETLRWLDTAAKIVS